MNGRKIDQFIRGVRLDREKVGSFYNVATNIDELSKEIPGDFLKGYGGKSLHDVSYGESFFALIMNKFGKNGIYILDEPEAALSPIRQMSLISRMDDELVKGGSQFIIATHSPILMAYPKSFIYEIKENIERVSYEESENYNITKDFLNNYKKMIHILTK